MARSCSPICLPVDQAPYRDIVDDSKRSRRWLGANFRDSPELFPHAFAGGYRLKDSRTSAKMGPRLRRIRCKSGGPSSVRPGFALPYLVGSADEARDPLFLGAFGVPFRALARVFGRSAMYWYRLEVSPGRNSVVGTTARRAELPEHLLADEHHRPRDGAKNYVATTVAEGCCLGAALAQTAGAEDLQAAYGAFASEARDVRPDHQPRTVGVDGWASTHQAWQALFPLVALLRCFLHGWLNIRSRGKLSESFAAQGTELLNAGTLAWIVGFQRRECRGRRRHSRPRVGVWLEKRGTASQEKLARTRLGVEETRDELIYPTDCSMRAIDLCGG